MGSDHLPRTRSLAVLSRARVPNRLVRHDCGIWRGIFFSVSSFLSCSFLGCRGLDRFRCGRSLRRVGDASFGVKFCVGGFGFEVGQDWRAAPLDGLCAVEDASLGFCGPYLISVLLDGSCRPKFIPPGRITTSLELIEVKPLRY